jgi:hypothetical protein
MTFGEWLETEPMTGHTNAEYMSAWLGWTAGQKAERERIKSRVKEAAENLWSIRNQIGEEPYSLYIGPSLNTLDDFVEKLLEEE